MDKYSQCVINGQYFIDLDERDNKIPTPKFTKERDFGYIITNEVELKRLRKYLKQLDPKVRCFDTETMSEEKDSIRKARLVGLSISFGRKKHQNFYIPCGHTVIEPYGEQLSLNKTLDFAEFYLLRDEAVLGAHNALYDFHILANHGKHILKYTRRRDIKIYDTMIASWLVDENMLKGLKFQAKSRLKNRPYVPVMKEYGETVATVPNDIKRKHGMKPNQKATIDLVEIDIAGDYAINDSIAVLDLMEIYEYRLWDESPLWDRFHMFEMEYFYVAYKMERRGTRLNMPLLRQYKKDITKHIAELEEELFSKVGYAFSVNSTKALPKLIYEELGFPVVKYTDPKKNKSGTSNPSTDKEALEMLLDFRRTLLLPMEMDLKDLEKKTPTKITKRKIKELKRRIQELDSKLEIVQLIVDVRLLKHLDSNFITGLLNKQINGVIYSRFQIAGTVTGRLSSSDPNSQNIPNDVKDTDPRNKYSIRDLFMARKGYTLLVADFSNLELRVLAHIAQDEALIEAFLSGQDPHSSTAINMNTQHRLSRMEIEPDELKKLAGMDKVIYHYENDVMEMYKKEPKLIALIDKYMYKDGSQSTVKGLVKKVGNKQAYNILKRLQKEAKDLRAEGKLLNFA